MDRLATEICVTKAVEAYVWPAELKPLVTKCVAELVEDETYITVSVRHSLRSAYCPLKEPALRTEENIRSDVHRCLDGMRKAIEGRKE